MRCAWQEYLDLLPQWLKKPVDELGKEELLELRLRNGQPPELINRNGSITLTRCIRDEDLDFCINAASRYSPWAANTTALCYITAPGGHRIGICGSANSENGSIRCIRRITSLSVRVARDFTGIASNAPLVGSVLILGCPGSGKTTLLRELIRRRSDAGGQTVAVVDEREEIFPYSQGSFCFPTGKHVDILSGSSKTNGIDCLLKVMTPDVIAIDEITSQNDCQALLSAGWCGVSLLATAHAASFDDLFRRPIYKPIVDSRLFSYVMTLDNHKNWQLETMYQ